MWTAVSCPACGRPCRGRPVRLEAGLAARAAAAGRRPVRDGRLYLLLEDVRSLWNVGSMFRSADAFGVAHVFLCGITATPPHAEIRRTALGADEAVSWSYHPHAFDAPLEGVTLVGLERAAGARPLSTYVPSGSVCLGIGNEPGGLSPELLSVCQSVLEIPMRGVKESLNAAVACGVGLYHLTSR